MTGTASHRWLAAFSALLALALSAGPALAQKESAAPAAEAPPPDPLPPYPRVNLAPWYEVDPSWPKRPAEFVWAAMSGIAVDRDDNIYVFTRSKPPIQVYRPDGTFVRSWGDDTIGIAHHLKIDQQGNIWVADIGLHVVRQFTPDGRILRTLGTEGMKGSDETHLNKPTDMAVTPAGDVFISDGYGNNRVVHYDANGKFVREWGRMGVGPDEFSLPHAIAVDSKGRLYVADRNNVRVQVFDQKGRLLDSWANVIVPWGFDMTPRDELWVCGSSPMPWQEDPKYPGAPLSCPPRDQMVMLFNTSGRPLQLWTIPKGEDGKEQPGDVNWIHAVAADSQGNLYIGDIIGKRAQKFVRQQR
jgi:hypothetical protein